MEASFFDLGIGRMAYVDVGNGDPIVFVHGNPSSSREFRAVIERLQGIRRCIAPDHLGFGASDKPVDWDYLPSSHASNLASLLDTLDLHDVTVVAGDWGGPIGLSWVLDHPDRVRSVVLTNTWMWPVHRSLYYQGFSRFMGGPIGKLLTRRYNFFARQVPKRAWGTRVPYTGEIEAEFTAVHTRPDERTAMWVFPREIVGSTAWLESLWARRSVLDQMDLTFVWGMKDIAFRSDILDVWTEAFPDAVVVRLDDVGHFPAIEAAEQLDAVLRQSAD